MARRDSTTRGFARTSTLLQARIRKAGESRGFAVSRLLTHWPEIVGPEIAGMARPVEVKYGRQTFGATLTVLTTGPLAPMVEMQKERMRERVNAAYGYNAISKVRVTQTAPTGFAEGQVDFAARAAETAPRALAPEIVKDAEAFAAPVGDDGLRQALEKLAANVLSKSRRSET